jgi:hypothetical protein
MDYNNKYRKYKNKYLKLQKGGTMCNLDDWVEIENNGQQNCGIFIHRINPSLIMKCGATMSNNVYVINSQASLFPKEYSECTDERGRTYLIMERLDGDITSIYFNLISINVLHSMNLSDRTIRDMKMIFDIKTPTTMKPIIPRDSQVNILATISATNNSITLELYDIFIDRIIQEWQRIHPIIVKEIVRVQLKLIELGYTYNDWKFDNFGYNLTETIIDTDFRQGDVPILFGKYLYIYFLDPASGLETLVDINNDLDHYFEYNHTDSRKYSRKEIDETVAKFKEQIDLEELRKIYNDYMIIKETKQHKNYMLYSVNSGFDLSVHGQYALSYINQKIRGEWNIKSNKYDELPSYYSVEIKKILDKEYRCELDTYDFKTIEDVIIV